MRRFFRKLKLSKRKIITLSLVVLVFVMSLGYAALSQYMDIEGLAMIDRSWIIKVVDMRSETSGNGVNISNTFVSSTVTMNAELPDSSSTVTYFVTLENQGNLKAKLSNIDRIEDENTAITYSISGVVEGETVLNPGETNIATITIKYADGVTNVSEIKKSLMLTFNYVEVESSNSSGGNGSSDTSETYAVFKVGQKVTLVDGSDWYVTKYSNSAEEYVTLLSASVTNDSIYFDDWCEGADYELGNPEYGNYTIRNYIEEDYLPNLKNSLINSDGDARGLSGRLLTYEEYESIVASGKTDILATGDTWTMTHPENDYNSVYYLESGEITSKNVIACDMGAVRPVIIVKKSNVVTLSMALLKNNISQSDTSIDLTKTSYYKKKVEVHSDTLYEEMVIDEWAGISGYYSTGYTFDDSRGIYTLSGDVIQESWSSMESKYSTYLYTCENGYKSCSVLYKINRFVDQSTISYYPYTSSNSEEYVENGKGLYYTSNNTEDNKITHYFRGNVENNYVKFGKFSGYCKVSSDYYNGPITYQDGTMLSESQCLQTTTACEVYDSSFGVFAAPIGDGCGADASIDVTPEWITDDILWRIVRINEDGSVRLITQEIVQTGLYNNFEGDNAYVGYMYGKAGSDNYLDTHKNTNDSTIKKIVDDWYIYNLSNYTDLLSNEAGFCNDRSIASGEGIWSWGNYGETDTALGYGDNLTLYGAYNRLENLKQPQFKCPQTNDLFTLKVSNKGNKTLKNPVGLLTADEVYYAGSNNSYLKNNSLWWTMSPVWWDYFSGYNANVYFGNLSHNYVGGSESSYEGIRPVININGSVGFTLEGTGEAGTINNPYIISAQ